MAPQPLTVCRQRDHPSSNHARVTSAANDSVIGKDAYEHTFHNLSQLYTSDHIRYYDLGGLGFQATAQRLAQEIPTDFPVASYLDLGAGTGLTTIACAKPLTQLEQEFDIVMVDGLRDLLDKALLNLHREVPQVALRSDISVINDDVLNFSQRMPNRISTTTFSLITAERVFLNVRKNQRPTPIMPDEVARAAFRNVKPKLTSSRRKQLVLCRQTATTLLSLTTSNYHNFRVR